ncbi:MAG: hypothetical protein RLZZ584_96 [Pseudomonadota bacterium]|jgi:uncharacterized membrane protein
MSVQSQILIRTIRPLQPLGWLERAWHDIRLTPALSFGHGAALAAFGGLMLLVAHHRFWVLAGALSGFLLVAPILATGLYAISRALERGEPVGVGTVWRVWRSFDRRLMLFGALLALAGTGWVVTSAALITLFAPAPVAMPADFLRVVVADTRGWLFEVWLALGGLLAAPVFASTVVALPLLLDRDIRVLDAVLASWRVVMDNPVPMAVWAALVMGFCLLGLGAALMGLVFVIPMLGHASWYAYRDLVDASALPLMQR